MLAGSALLGIVSSGVALWNAVEQRGDSISLVVTIDRLLLVLMVIEILRTVRVSIQSGALVSEPSWLWASVASHSSHRLLLRWESSRVTQQGNWTPEGREIFNSTMVELAVLGVA